MDLGGRPARRARSARRAVVCGLAAVTLLAGCTTSAPAPSEPSLHTPTGAPDAPMPSPSASDDGTSFPAGPALAPATDEPVDVLTGLTTPWGLAFLPGGALLVTLRDPAQVLLVTADVAAPLAGPGADELAASTRAEGEGGLLGVAVSPDVARDRLVYLYRTTSEGNEVVRARLEADASLGPLETVLAGIPAARNHDGGRIAFGPDGRLYVGTGDAGVPDAAQDPTSLAGKILRITAEGEPAPGNPDPESPVWSLGHRNVQGLAWTPDGTLLASELGQDTTDELNRIEPGDNYGWPLVEGVGGREGLTDPVVTWTTDEASPSGIAVAGDAVHVAALRGERLWTVGLVDAARDPDPTASLDLGRLRDVVAGPDGALWVLTQNTDGRGEPRPGDDRLVRLLPPSPG